LPIFVEWLLKESYPTNITHFQVTGTPLWPGNYCRQCN